MSVQQSRCRVQQRQYSSISTVVSVQQRQLPLPKKCQYYIGTLATVSGGSSGSGGGGGDVPMFMFWKPGVDGGMCSGGGERVRE